MENKDYTVRREADGKTVTVNGPVDASQEQIRAAAQRAFDALDGEAGGGGAVATDDFGQDYYPETRSNIPPIQDRPFGVQPPPKVKYGEDEQGRQTMTNLETGVTYTKNAQGQFEEPLDFGYNLGKAIEFIPGGLATQDPVSFTRGLEYARNALLSPSFQRTAPPITAALIFPPSLIGTGPSLTLSAIAGLAGSNAAGDPVPEQIKNMIYSAYPGGVRAREAGSLMRSLGWEVPKEMLTAAAYSTGTELIGRSVEAGRLVLFDDGIDWAKTVGPMALFGSATGAIKGWGANSSYYARKINATRSQLGDFLGLDNVTLGLVDPESFARIESELAKSNPSLARKIQSIGKNTTERYSALFGDVANTAEIADKLNVYAGRVKQETEALDVLVKAKEKADADVAMAKEINISPEKIIKAEQEAIAAEMAIINQRARVNFWSGLQAREAGIIVDLQDSIDNFKTGVSDIFKARKNAATNAYNATGVSYTEKIFDKEQLASAAEAALANRDTPESRLIVEYIKKFGGEDKLLSVNELRELRGGIARALKDADPRALTNSEGMANAAYSAVLEKTNQIVNDTFGPDVGKKFRDVNSWYSRTIAAQNSKFTRALLSKEPNQDVLSTLADNVANGKMQSSKDFFAWLDVIAEQAPDVANNGRTLYYNAVRDGFLMRATKGRSTIDLKKLSTDLNNAAARKFPVEMLGFGTAEQVSNVAKTFNKYSKSGVTAQELDEFYSNPLVQAEIAAGRDVSSLAKVQAYKNEWIARVKEDMLRGLTGARARNSEFDVLSKEKLARQAGLSVQEQERLIASLRKDPLMQAFSSTSSGMANRFKADRQGITDSLMKMTPNDLDEVMRAMRRSRPDIANEVSRRVSADIFGSLFRPKAGGGFFIDPDMLGQILQPPIAGDRQSANRMLRSVLTPDEYKRFSDALPAFERLSRYYNSGGTVPIGKDLQTMFGVTTAASLDRIGGASGFVGLLNHVMFMARSLKYRALSRILIDKDFANAYASYVSGGLSGRSLANERQLQRFAIILQSDPELAEEINDSNAQ